MLLEEARKYPVGTECAMLLDLDMEQIGNIIVGNIDNAKIPRCSEYHFALHNHSSGLTFSVGDIETFAKSETMLMLTAIGNNGRIYTLSKTTSFDSEEFINYFKEMKNKPIFKEKSFNQLDKEYVKTLSNAEKNELRESLIDFSENLLKGAALNETIVYTY